MHVEADLLDDVGDVRVGERQVLEGPNEALEVSRISNRRPRLDGDLGLHVHRANELARSGRRPGRAWCGLWLT
jgi:hypothetical protein